MKTTPPIRRRAALLAAFAATPLAALAQSTSIVEDTLTPLVAEQRLTFAQIMEYGGWLMYVLGAMSVVGLALVIYFMAVLRREQVLPGRFVHGVRDLLRAGQLNEARAACHASGSAIAVILEAALDYVLRTDRPDSGLVREIVEGEGSRQASLMQNQTQYLLDIAVIAPMIGLLGTVVGMLKAFSTIALDLAKARPMQLAEGVAQALVTTVAGLVVAIPAMMAYAWFRGRTTKLVAELETASARLVADMEQGRKP